MSPETLPETSTGNVTGNVTGDVTGGVTLPANGTVGVNASNALQFTSSSHAVLNLGGSGYFVLQMAVISWWVCLPIV